MRYFVIFGTTVLLVLLILFLPQKYLYKYDKQITIDYNAIIDTDDNLWEYEISNKNISLVDHLNKKWVFKANKNGKVLLTFYYDKKDDNNKYKIEYSFNVKNNKIYWLDGISKGLLDFPNPY